MKSIKLISFILFTSFALIYCKNYRPLIAVLSQDRHNKTGSFIVASYVKYLESAGARVVPVLIDQKQEYYEKIVNQTDGLLIPGGGVDLHTSGFSKAGQMIWNYIMNSSRPYPIWGTCLGFEQLLIFVDPKYNLDNCSAHNVANPLTFTSAGRNSRIFEKASKLIQILESEKVTYNYHQKCLLADTSRQSKKINDFFNILTTTKDKNGLEYVSTIESKKGHVYATIWHPEKTMFEFSPYSNYSNVPHTSNAVLVSQYMANFFVEQVRQLSNRTMLRVDVEHKLLIYNYKPVYTGNKNNYEYEQIYYFNTSRASSWCVSLFSYILFIPIILIFK